MVLQEILGVAFVFLLSSPFSCCWLFYLSSILYVLFIHVKAFYLFTHLFIAEIYLHFALEVKTKEETRSLFDRELVFWSCTSASITVITHLFVQLIHSTDIHVTSFTF